MTACPACGQGALRPFHEQPGVPTNSCLLLASREEALAYPRGDLLLGFCPRCEFIGNTAFDPRLAEYSARYEETQAFSPRFRQFAEDLAKRWVHDFDLHGKTVLEIGCGKGEFLVAMCEQGVGRGIGIDPGVNPDRVDGALASRLEWIRDFYSEDYAHLEADAVVCRHTLEHIQPVGEFMHMVARAIGGRPGVPVLFELPDTLRVLREVAFWDTYYEHCSYFTAASLSRLFADAGFDVTDVRLAYDDQYLLLEARPATGTRGSAGPCRDAPLDLAPDVEHFRSGYEATVARWRQRIGELEASGGRAAIWGGGSKGVAFLNALGGDLVAYAVDINPYKQGMFMAGTGHAIVGPAHLREEPPDLVVAMNAIYTDEIRADLDASGVDARLVAL